MYWLLRRSGRQQRILNLLNLEDTAHLAPSRLRDRKGVFFLPASFPKGSLSGPGSAQPETQEFIVSKVNGDKSRYNRIRKQKIARRLRNHEMLKNMPTQSVPSASAASPSKTTSE